MNRKDLRQPYPFHNQPAAARAPHRARTNRTPKPPVDLSWVIFAMAAVAVVAAILQHV